MRLRLVSGISSDDFLEGSLISIPHKLQIDIVKV